jgi:gluconolactonase
VKEVVATGLELPEGPVVLPDGRIVFVEQRLGQVSVFDGTDLSCLARVGGAANAVTLGDDGLYAAQNGGVVGAWRSADPQTPGIQRVHLDGQVEYVTTAVDGQPLLAPNDLVFGPDGRLWFTDPGHPYDPVRRGSNGRLLAIGQGNDEILADVGPVYCNGLAFGVDDRLIWVESYGRHVCRLGPAGREELCQLPDGHIPDGLAVADDGRLFIATVDSTGITVVSPDGVVLDFIELDPTACPTNCCFDGHALWVTDFGHEFKNVDGCGRLWRVETDATGAIVRTGAVAERCPEGPPTGTRTHFKMINPRTGSSLLPPPIATGYT